MSAHAARSPRVSVVVPTYRRPALLERNLRAVLAQSLPSHDYEVIVVDDGPGEDTRALVERVAAGTATPVRYVTAPDTQGPAGARNRGWRAAAAPIVAFTDDDTEPDPRWLEEGLAALANPDVVGLWGRVVVPVPPRPTDHERMTKGLESAGFVTANVFVRRAALDAVGGFDERYRRAWREDSDLYFRLIDRVGAVDHAPRAIVVHPVRPARWGISLSQQANVFFDALLYREHPRHYRTRIRRVPPWRYYLIVAATLAAAGAALAGRRDLALLAAAAAGVAVLQFAAERLRGASLRPSHVAEMLVTSAAIPFLSLYWRVRGALHFRVMFL